MAEKNNGMIYSDEGAKKKRDLTSVIVIIVCVVMSVILVMLGVKMFI